MIAQPEGGDVDPTRLFFGTAVAPARDRLSGQATWSFTFKALLSFHRLYARGPLYTARSRLARI